jgi:ribosomal protein S2
MKINKIKFYNFKLTKLKLIKEKIYKKNKIKFTKIEDININLKKALHIIYQYHINNKKIVFIVTSINIDLSFKKLFKKTRHIIIPSPLWMSGFITNKLSCFKYLSKNKKLINNKIPELLFKMKNKIDLIVILDNSKKTLVLNESYVSRIPVISLNYNIKITNEKSSYKIPGNFQSRKKKNGHHFFYYIFTTMIKKANKK